MFVEWLRMIEIFVLYIIICLINFENFRQFLKGCFEMFIMLFFDGFIV